MVNQTYRRLTTIDSNTADDIRTVLPVLNILQRISINNREILYIQAIDGINISHDFVVSFLDSMFLCKRQAILQRLIDGWCNSTFILRQQRVTRTASQAVLITYDVTGPQGPVGPAAHQLSLAGRKAILSSGIPFSFQ